MVEYGMSDAELYYVDVEQPQKQLAITAEQLWDLLTTAIDTLAFVGHSGFFKLNSESRNQLCTDIAKRNWGALPQRIKTRFTRT